MEGAMSERLVTMLSAEEIAVRTKELGATNGEIGLRRVESGFLRVVLEVGDFGADLHFVALLHREIFDSARDVARELGLAILGLDDPVPGDIGALRHLRALVDSRFWLSLAFCFFEVFLGRDGLRPGEHRAGHHRDREEQERAKHEQAVRHFLLHDFSTMRPSSM